MAHALLGIADSLWLIILSRVLAGIMAGNLGVAFAYTADVTTSKNRAKSFGRLTTGFTLGFTFGPAIGGLLAGTDIDTANFMVPAFSAAALSIFACFCVIAFLRESLPPEKRSASATGKPHSSLTDQFKMVLRVDILAKLALVSFLFFMAWTVLLSIFALWSNRVLERGQRKLVSCSCIWAW